MDVSNVSPKGNFFTDEYYKGEDYRDRSVELFNTYTQSPVLELNINQEQFGDYDCGWSKDERYLACLYKPDYETSGKPFSLSLFDINSKLYKLVITEK